MDFIGSKDHRCGGDNLSNKMCKASPPTNSLATMPCITNNRDNNIKMLKPEEYWLVIPPSNFFPCLLKTLDVLFTKHLCCTDDKLETFLSRWLSWWWTPACQGNRSTSHNFCLYQFPHVFDFALYIKYSSQLATNTDRGQCTTLIINATSNHHYAILTKFTTIISTFSFCLTGLFSGGHCMLGQVLHRSSKEEPFLMWCPSCHQMNTGKALNEKPHKICKTNFICYQSVIQ